MKLAIATGILAQALPTLSQRAVNLIPQERHDNVAKSLASSGRDSDVSLDKAHKQRRAALANVQSTNVGLLTNQRRRVNKQDTIKYCNPTSSDPDVGILSCGQGMSCHPSEESMLGGRCEVNQRNNMGWSKLVNGQGKDGLLKNIRAGSFNHIAPTEECDPTSTADVGILSCGDGAHCVASSLSTKGGFCMQSLESRQLQAGSVGVCDPTSNYYTNLNCDCSDFDNVTGTGDVPCTVFEDFCLGLLYAGCGSACLTRVVTYQFVNFTSPVYNYCLELNAPNQQKVCIDETMTNTCSMTLDDQLCNSCSVVSDGNTTTISFNCSNAGGINGTTDYWTQMLPKLAACYTPSAGSECDLCTANNTVFDPKSFFTPVSIPNLGNFTCYDLYYTTYAFASISNDYCPAVSDVAAGACCGIVCELCGTGSYIPKDNYNLPLDIPLSGYESVTCGNLIDAAYYNFTITSDLCPSAASVAKSKCCIPYVQNSCDVCDGQDLLYPDAVVSVYGYDLPCKALETLLNETTCTAAKSDLATTCCGTKSNDAPPTSQSAPQPTSSDAVPTSSSSTLVVAKNILSIIGVTTVALIFGAK